MPALTEPVSLALAKQHLRIAAADVSEDVLIGGYIRAAREWVEQFTGRILIRRNVTETFSGFGQLVMIAARPVHSVVSVTYFDSDGTSQAYTGARLIGFAGRNILMPALSGSWPWATGALVTLDAGYPIGEEPGPLVSAMLLLMGHFYANREAVNIGNITTEVPFGVEALCQQYRPVRI